VMAFGSDDNLKVVATGGGRNRDLTVDAHTVFHRVKGDWTFHQGGITSVFAPFAGYDLASGEFNSTTFGADVYNLGGREDLTLELFPALTARTGFDIVFSHTVATAKLPVLSGDQYVAFPGAEPATELQTLTRIFNTFDGAGFLEGDLKLGPLTLTPGLRGSYARVRGHELVAWDPRFWVTWKLLPRTAVKGSVGLYTQPPDGMDLEPPPLGNPNLVHEKAFQTSLGVDHAFTDVLNVDLTGYYNRRFDLVTGPGTTIKNDDGSITRYPYTNDGLGRAYGLELLLRHEVTRDFFGWIAYTLNRSEARVAGSGDPYVVTSYDETHILTAVGSYRLPLGFELGARFRYVTGRPYTPIGHPYDLYDVDGNRFRGVTGDPRSARYRDFNQLDVRLDKHFVFRDWTLTAYLDVQNVYNAQNTEALMYDYRYRQTVEVPGIPFLPVLGVKGSF